MEFTNTRIVQITAGLLLMLVVTQALFLVFFMANVGIPRQLFLQSQPVVLLWGLEGLLFTTLAAFAGAAIVQAKNYHLGWSAIAFSAVLNVVQVSVGLTMFGTLAGDVEAPVYSAVTAFSFMVYYAVFTEMGLKTHM